MFCESDTIESLKLKLKSVTKRKLSKEKEVIKLRTMERSFVEELNSAKAESDFLTEQLEVLKNQITQSKHQISMIDICSSSETLKTETHISTMNEHLEGFQQLFDRDLRELEQRLKEQRENEAEKQEVLRQQEKQLSDEQKKQEKEVAIIEKECEAIEQECVVLKKRNNAIMLKLRKRLLEVENTRREAMKRNTS